MSHPYYRELHRLGVRIPGGGHGSSELRRVTEAFADAATVGEPLVRRHILVVAWFAFSIGDGISLDGDSLETLTSGALLHDIGKLAVPYDVLTKRDSLTDEEWETVRLHPEIGARIVEPLDVLSGVREVILHHHERYDGTGYPHGLAGEEIPLLARIVTVADSVSAMALDRFYREKLSGDRVTEELADGSGTQFDPALVESALGILGRFREGEIEQMFP